MGIRLQFHQRDRASAFERASGPQTVRSGNGGARLFSAGGKAAFASRGKIAGLGHRGPRKRLGLPDRTACALFVAMKAATVAVQTMEHPMYAHDEFEPDHTSSPRGTMIQEVSAAPFKSWQ